MARELDPRQGEPPADVRTNVRTPMHPSPRSEILHAAARAVAAHGFHGMSMRKLAQATGRSTASFYNYFPSKEAVLFAIQSEAFDVLLARARSLLGRFVEPEERLYAFVLNHVRYFASHDHVMRVLIQEATALAPPQRGLVRERKLAYFTLASELVSSVMPEGTPYAEVEKTTYCVFGVLNWIYGWYDPVQHGAPDGLARTIMHLVSGGLVERRTDDALLARVEAELSDHAAPALIADGEQEPIR